MKKSDNQKNTVVCVLGMHRSGTSMIMRLLNICGVYVGKEKDLVPAGDGNERGHWEHKEVLEINDEILRRLGGNCVDVPSFPIGWENDDRFEDLKVKAMMFVDEMNNQSNIWGFKEPRTCLTLPFWQIVIPNMKYVIVVRSPMNVAKSFKKRKCGNHFKIEEGLDLWSKYWYHIYNNTLGENVSFTIHKKYFEDWKYELGHVLQYINLNLSYKNCVQDIDSFIDIGMFHNKAKEESEMIMDEIFGELSPDVARFVMDELMFEKRYTQEVYQNSLNQKEMEILSKNNEINRKNERIYKMRSSKFWKLRNLYLNLKKRILFGSALSK